jgi:hypothetical protein
MSHSAQGHGAIDDQSECPNLRFRPVIAEDDRNRFELQLLGRFQSQMAIDDIASARRQNRNFESELLNRGAHAIDCMIVFAWVLAIGNQLIDPSIHQLKIGREGWIHHRSSNSMFAQPSPIFWPVCSSTCSATIAPIRSKILWICPRVQTADILQIRSAV